MCVDLLVMYSLQAVSVIDAFLHTNPTTTPRFEFLSAERSDQIFQRLIIYTLNLYHTHTYIYTQKDFDRHQVPWIWHIHLLNCSHWRAELLLFLDRIWPHHVRRLWGFCGSSESIMGYVEYLLRFKLLLRSHHNEHLDRSNNLLVQLPRGSAWESGWSSCKIGTTSKEIGRRVFGSQIIGWRDTIISSQFFPSQGHHKSAKRWASFQAATNLMHMEIVSDDASQGPPVKCTTFVPVSRTVVDLPLWPVDTI